MSQRPKTTWKAIIRHHRRLFGNSASRCNMDLIIGCLPQSRVSTTRAPRMQNGEAEEPHLRQACCTHRDREKYSLHQAEILVPPSLGLSHSLHPGYIIGSIEIWQSLFDTLSCRCTRDSIGTRTFGQALEGPISILLQLQVLQV